ncbi:MAG: DUF929 family protein [Thermoplasmata archaeon]
MVDWDRVEQLRKSGWDWDEIAEDPKVGFQATKGSGDPARALAVLYRKRKVRTPSEEETAVTKPGKRATDEADRKWGLARIGYVLVPLVGVWALVAYLAPSPVGLILPTIPYVALILVGVVFVLIYGLLRSTKRWTKVYRNTVIGGIVLGLVFTGIVALAGSLIFGCPYLPPAAALGREPGPGWAKASVAPWQENGNPVVYFYGASWCPYCSASSWAIWKALTEFGTLSNNYTGFSSLGDVYAGTPEMVLGNAVLTSSNVSFIVSEDLSGADGTFPATSNCVQAAYVGAYAGGSIPFVVLNGQYVHGGSSLISPPTLSSYTYGNTGGAGANTVRNQIFTESGPAWNAVASQTEWIMAFLVNCLGGNAPYFAAHYHWSGGVEAGVKSYLLQIT